MSWKQWRIGVLVAILTGVATGAIGLVAGVTWKQFLVILIPCVAKDFLLFIKEHPVTSIVEDAPTVKLPLLLLGFAFCIGAAIGCSSLNSHQVRIDTDGVRTESSLRVRTFMDGRSSIAKARASTTDKSQGLTLSGVEQESNGSNAVSIVSEVVGAAVRAAVKP